MLLRDAVGLLVGVALRLVIKEAVTVTVSAAVSLASFIPTTALSTTASTINSITATTSHTIVRFNRRTLSYAGGLTRSAMISGSAPFLIKCPASSALILTFKLEYISWGNSWTTSIPAESGAFGSAILRSCLDRYYRLLINAWIVLFTTHRLTTCRHLPTYLITWSHETSLCGWSITVEG